MPTFNFSPDVDALLVEAWERCGKSPAALTAEIAQSCIRSFQLALIDFSNKGGGNNLWQIEIDTTTVSVGEYLLPLPAGTIDVLDIVLTDTTGIDITLEQIGRDQYIRIPQKTLSARPTQYWCNRQEKVPVLYLWPVPDLTYTMRINRFRLPHDVSGLSGKADIPVIWMEALASDLAARFAEKWAPERVLEKRQLAAMAYENARGEERERVPMKIMPRIMM